MTQEQELFISASSSLPHSSNKSYGPIEDKAYPLSYTKFHNSYIRTTTFYIFRSTAILQHFLDDIQSPTQCGLFLSLSLYLTIKMICTNSLCCSTFLGKGKICSQYAAIPKMTQFINFTLPAYLRNLAVQCFILQTIFSKECVDCVLSSKENITLSVF